MSQKSSQEKYMAYLRDVAMNRRRFLQGSLGVAGSLAAAQFLAACAPAAAPAPSGAETAAGEVVATGPQPGGRLVFAAETIGESLEPGLWNGFGITNVHDNVGAYLTRPNSSGVWTDPPEPSLAESWEVSDDGLVYTFKIRPGVKFHDGTDVDANAIVRSLTRQVNPDDSSYVEGLYMHTNYTVNRKSIEATDDMTVVIELERPDAAYLYRLFHPSAITLSPASLDEFGAGINTNLVSCGPFKVERFVPGSEVTLVAFEDFWEGRPNLDEIIMRGYPDEGAMLAAIESGEVNFAPYPPSSAVPRLQQSDAVKVMAGEPVVNLFLGCCMLNAPMDNRDVRFAINYAINRENLIQAVLYGLGEAPATFVGPTEFGFDTAGYEVSKQDLDLAAEHVAASGLPTPIELALTYESNRFWPQMAELLKSDLEAVGFAVTLDPQDAGTYWGKVLGGESQLNMNQRSLWVPDPDNKVTLLFSGDGSAQGETGIVGAMPEYSAKMDELLVAGRQETDLTRRAEIYKEIQDLILEELPYIMLAYYTKPTVMAANVNGLAAGSASTERIFLQSVWIG
ncbi:MAG: ABC transporter substrate-binding protein [Caldilineaceae bacterium]|nr:ABC transporter substrate-binding protein [Caldilineaceae bacterium]